MCLLIIYFGGYGKQYWTITMGLISGVREWNNACLSTFSGIRTFTPYDKCSFFNFNCLASVITPLNSYDKCTYPNFFCISLSRIYDQYPLPDVHSALVHSTNRSHSQHYLPQIPLKPHTTHHTSTPIFRHPNPPYQPTQTQKKKKEI